MDLVPRLVKWKREQAKGVYFTWIGISFGWRKENEVYWLNEAMKAGR